MSLHPLAPYTRAGRKFRKAAEASSRRFRSKVQYACDKARADPAGLNSQIEQARAEFREELEQAALQFKVPMPAIAQCLDADQLDRVEQYPDVGEQSPGAKVEREVARCRALKAGHPRHRADRPVRKRRRRPRDLGGEPAPVEPCPKPLPLMDGAQAPIE